MTLLKINIAQALLLAFLVIFGLEMVSVGILNHINEGIYLTQFPIDCEEEEEKEEKEKEFDDRLTISVINANLMSLIINGYFLNPTLYNCVPRAVATPPPDFRS